MLLAAGFIAVAAPVQIYRLTESSLQVGLVSLALGMTKLFGFIAGGVLADRMDRRKLILISSVTVVLAFSAFAVNAALASSHELLFIYLIVIVGAGVEGIGETALSAVTPALVAPEHLAAGSGLIAVTSQLGFIVGPALGGVIIAGAGLPGTYAAAAVAILISTALLATLPSLPPGSDESSADDKREGVFASISEGFRFVRHNKLIRGVLIIDLCATGFGVPQTLFPQLVAEVFHGGPEMIGLLAAAPAVGALLASVSSGWTGLVRRSGRALIVAVLLMGAAYIGFGLSPHLVPAMVFLAIIGGVDSVSEILRRALLMHHTPDHLQGRVNSLWLAQASSSYSLGSTTSGFAASLFGPALAIIGAGALCISGVAALASTSPELREATLTVDEDTVDPAVSGSTGKDPGAEVSLG
ncbi:MFS transporter, ENTS family, enterobactin (siderophore) exporter [Actinokineospora alba]|uniref:MFS transporter, ENTS family, enterobactin (Siderophore) exporter n=1 Tax=Actinokineospora alba TaxID=504798 RepID=A0A1H0VHE1_9PSEU|nr:MFS transporter, ENTS family, enterobactin (siderophore) exporter [Actinokineospora alba]SDP77506.1 MFS transporter, ENTS family, enterobactin (siderophore) exporter [Actinokineospora alba]